MHGDGVNVVGEEEQGLMDYSVVMRKPFLPDLVKVETECLS